MYVVLQQLQRLCIATSTCRHRQAAGAEAATPNAGGNVLRLVGL
jgi:hypothetical protein